MSNLSLSASTNESVKLVSYAIKGTNGHTNDDIPESTDNLISRYRLSNSSLMKAQKDFVHSVNTIRAEISTIGREIGIVVARLQSRRPHHYHLLFRPYILKIRKKWRI